MCNLLYLLCQFGQPVWSASLGEQTSLSSSQTPSSSPSRQTLHLQHSLEAASPWQLLHPASLLQAPQRNKDCNSIRSVDYSKGTTMNRKSGFAEK